MVARLLVVTPLMLAACASADPAVDTAGRATQADEPTPATLEFIEGDAPGAFELVCPGSYSETNYDYGAGAGSPTMTDEARRVLSVGTWYIDGKRMATFDDNGTATRILYFGQGASGNWVRQDETACVPSS